MSTNDPDSSTRLVFIRESISHLEDRITTVDNKGNILIGVALASIAVSGTFINKALENDLALGWEITILLAAAIQLIMSGSIILRCLLLLNPRKASPESTGYVFPNPYLLWPRRNQPWTISAEAHGDALRNLTVAQIEENLVAMQTTLIFLIDAKYRHYRLAIKLSKGLITTILVVLGTAGIASAAGN